jgi:hypothetical protein
MTEIPPVRREVVVDAGPLTAFTVFTDEIGSWWPMTDFSVHGDGVVRFEDGRIVETSAAGETAVWGTVLRWEAPDLLEFTWHPGTAPDRATTVTVAFAAAGAGTLVTLVHRGWERRGAEARDGYEQGWPVVLGAFARRVPVP